MRLATLRIGGLETACLEAGGGFLPLAAVNARLGTDWPTEMLALFESGRLRELGGWAVRELYGAAERCAPDVLCAEAVRFAPLYRRPRKIWGIGLNYREHAADLDEKVPTGEPASFMKPDTAIIGHGDTVLVPRQSRKTTAEAELALVFGRRCRDVPRPEWCSVLAGFTTVIDMTAEDILRQNPRYLTLSKSFESFFSFGPQLVTKDEVEDVMRLNVATLHNGKVHAQNVVSHMTFPPDFLVSFHSKVMTMYPGDIISTGTPRAVHIQHGDKVACRIDGFALLECPVIDKKVAK
jgi:2-keto-4-pentenoate hydratase/2-oxohepta-3-ene-1,7-dioic acid hydratase in catechol pathway